MLRFENSTSLRFPASQLEALRCEPAATALDAASLGEAARTGALKYIRLTPAFMGLLGGGGALPVHYTERIAAHAVTSKDHGPRAFLDIFAHRSLALFYEGWRKYRLELKYQREGKDAFLPLLLSLAGLGNEALRRRLTGPEEGEVLDESIGHFAAAVRHRPTSAVQIGRVLADYFGAPVQVEQFVGKWYEVPETQQTMLGKQNSVLGVGAMVGERVWQRDLRMRLVVGPLKRESFIGFLPGGAAARALKSMLTMFTGVALEYEIQLVLRAADVCGISLGPDMAGCRLGWDTFLTSGEAPCDRGDVRYELHTL